MSIFRTIALFVYLFGYMILHYGILRRAERAAAAGDTATVEQIVNQHIPRWSRGILKVTGVSLSVEGAGEYSQRPPLRVRGEPPQLLRHPFAAGRAGKAPRHPCQGGAGKDSLAQPLDEAAGLCVRQAG